ncbi:hypothetical protein GN156_11420 [bacterium LRH843]|nr:hypothetical protein [bacterium LRH843]
MRTAMSVILLISILFGNDVTVFAKNESIGTQIEMLPWEKVNGILPKFSEFTVLDVETGKTFEVQRRAGRRHADVQPLTSRDTKVMKEIYGGKWSWKRRAIIVIHQGRWIAASMHGMPHGAGAIDNNFPGHFCIHFYGSKTHRTNYMDLSHKLMILKAAGNLDDYIAKANPYELIGAYVAGFKQQDETILSAISLQAIDWKEFMYLVDNMKLNNMSVLPLEYIVNETTLEVQVDIEWINQYSEKRFIKGNVHLSRFTSFDAWKIDSIRFLEDSRIEKERKGNEDKEDVLIRGY